MKRLKVGQLVCIHTDPWTGKPVGRVYGYVASVNNPGGKVRVNGNFTHDSGGILINPLYIHPPSKPELEILAGLDGDADPAIVESLLRALDLICLQQAIELSRLMEDHNAT